MPGEHAILSPSASDTWAECLGQLAATKNRPRKSGAAAALGTCKHEDSERWLVHGYEPQLSSKRSCDGFDFVVDEEYVRHCEYYVNYVRQQPGEKYFEVKLNTSNVLGVDGQFGRSDTVTLDYEKRQLSVIDAKFGYERCYAKKRQLKIYGAAALEQFDLHGDWDTVRLVIVQPQLDWIDELEMTRAEMAVFVADLRPRAMTAYMLWESGTPDEIRGQLHAHPDACRWCPLSGNCQEETRSKLNMFDEIKAETPAARGATVTDSIASLNNVQLGDARAKVEEMEEWCSAIRKEAIARALNGQQVAQHKLIRGKRGNRTWMKEQEDNIKASLEMVLGAEEMYNQTLLTPTQVEAALKKANAKGVYDAVKVFVHQPEGGLQLVHESDPRPAASAPISVDSFEVVT